MTTSSSGVADEEIFFFTQADIKHESEEQTLDPKEQSRQNAKQWVANEEASFLKTKWNNLQSSGKTLRRIPWMESRQMHKDE